MSSHSRSVPRQPFLWVHSGHFSVSGQVFHTNITGRRACITSQFIDSQLLFLLVEVVSFRSFKVTQVGLEVIFSLEIHIIRSSSLHGIQVTSGPTRSVLHLFRSLQVLLVASYVFRSLQVLVVASITSGPARSFLHLFKSIQVLLVASYISSGHLRSCS